MSTRSVAYYWDTSAVVSVLMTDEHSPAALRRLEQSGSVHFLSSLAHAEVEAVLARADRLGKGDQADSARRVFQRGPWRNVFTAPEPWRFAPLAQRWPLRGADLWHLTLAKSMSERLLGLELLTFDGALAEAAAGEGLSATA